MTYLFKLRYDAGTYLKRNNDCKVAGVWTLAGFVLKYMEEVGFPFTSLSSGRLPSSVIPLRQVQRGFRFWLAGLAIGMLLIWSAGFAPDSEGDFEV